MSADGIREIRRTLAAGKGFDNADELQFLSIPSHTKTGITASFESGASFTDRSPAGMARCNLVRAWLHCVGFPSRPRKWRQFYRSQFPGDGEVSFEFARGVIALGPPSGLESGNSFTDRSRQGMARSHLNLPVASLRWAPQQASKLAPVSQIAAPKGWRGLV